MTEVKEKKPEYYWNDLTFQFENVLIGVDEVPRFWAGFGFWSGGII